MKKIRFRYRLWTQFFTGLLLVVPVVVTIYVLLFIFRIVDNVLGGFFRLWLGRTIPGLGVLATLFLTFFIGRMATTVVGRYLIRWGEKLLDKIPLVRTVYTATKQITGAFSFSKQEVGETTYREVVLVPYPRRGIYTIGFITGRLESEEGVTHRRELIKVFLPSAPNILTGWVIIVPRQDIIPLNITVEEGFKIIASGGIAGPSQILRKK
jgi:uncharacterized membrane protein